MGDEARRSAREESLSTQPWHSITPVIGDQDTIMKYFFDRVNYSYDVMVYDGYLLRHERVGNEQDFKRKSTLFNPNLEAGSTSIMEELAKLLGDTSKSSQINLNFDGDILNMSIKTKLKSGIPFTWVFMLKETGQPMLTNHLVQPLTIMATELNRRQQELFHLLERKDREIQDYKDQGSVVSRRHLETLNFDSTNFQNTSNLNEVFLSLCSKPSVFSLSKQLKDIHRSTVLNIQTRKTITTVADETAAATIPMASASTFDTVPIDPSKKVESSWGTGKRVAASFAQDKMDGPIGEDPLQQDTDTQPVIPLAVPVSPQEEELKRREAIRKRLNEDAEKKSKKKRKIKL